MNEKIKTLLNKMKYNNINCSLISDPYQIFYLTGIKINPGERFLALLISEKEIILFNNKLFPLENSDFEIIWFDDTENPIEIVYKHIYGTVGVDKNLSSRFLLPIMDLSKECSFVLGSFILDSMRQVKDDEEINSMIEASNINDMAMEKICETLNSKISELEMVDHLKRIYKELGSNKFSFDPIIGYGKNCSDPHHENDDTNLSEGDSIIIDIGCEYKNYCSDMTRTFFYKSVSEEQIKVYETVLKANLEAISKVKPGVKCSDIDKTAREVIKNAGFEEYFTHRTGHFIGLEVHEYGDISANNDQILKEGNIFSIEPGIYIPNKFGVRIEDLVLVTKDGCRVLNNYPKELTIIK